MRGASILSLFFILTVCGYTEALPKFHAQQLPRAYTNSLFLDNAYNTDAGEWGMIDACPEGSFVVSFEVRYQYPELVQDETAINMVKLNCQSGMIDTGYVTSTEGNKGEDLGPKSCTTGPITGFRAQVLEDQGLIGDNVAIHDIEFSCSYGEEILQSGIPPQTNKAYQTGTWSSFAECRPETYVCGIQTRFEDDLLGLGDESAICDVVLLCCSK